MRSGSTPVTRNEVCIKPAMLTRRSGRETDVGALNRDELRVVEMRAGNGTGTARSVAKLYGSAATGGSEIGLSPSILDALKNPAIPPTKGLRDKVLHLDTAYSLGFCKPAPVVCFWFIGQCIWNGRSRRLVRIR